MLRVDRYKTAVFDCDGVILQSNHLKTEAFRSALADEAPALVDDFIAYHKRNGGVSRYQKFGYFFREMKGAVEHEVLAREAVSRYGAISREALIHCSAVPGVLELLTQLNNLDIRCYVVSGGDQSELHDVFSARGLMKYFRGIFGSPVAKDAHLKSLRDGEHLRLPGVYFGDARLDFDIARAFQLDFVFISGYSEWMEGERVCRDAGCKTYRDFMSLA